MCDILSSLRIWEIYYHLWYTATHCNILQHTATHYNTLQHTATHCNTLQHTFVRVTYFHPWKYMRHIMNLWHTATHCNTLQHTATHCNTRSYVWHIIIFEDICEKYDHLLKYTNILKDILSWYIIIFENIMHWHVIIFENIWYYHLWENMISSSSRIYQRLCVAVRCSVLQWVRMCDIWSSPRRFSRSVRNWL